MSLFTPLNSSFLSLHFGMRRRKWEVNSCLFLMSSSTLPTSLWPSLCYLGSFSTRQLQFSEICQKCLSVWLFGHLILHIMDWRKCLMYSIIQWFNIKDKCVLAAKYASRKDIDQKSKPLWWSWEIERAVIRQPTKIRQMNVVVMTFLISIVASEK